MAAVDNLGDSRPPPSRGRSLNIFTPGIPWYRDLRVLRIIAQVVFAVAFIGGVLYVINNMTTNLEESDLALDWNTYKSPFTVAIPEGPDETANWAWTDDLYDIMQFTRLGWSLAVTGLALTVLGAFGMRQSPLTARRRLHVWAAAALFGFVAFFFPLHASQITDVAGPATMYEAIAEGYLGGFAAGISPVLGWGLWLAALGGALGLSYLMIGDNLPKLLPFGIAAAFFVLAILFPLETIRNEMLAGSFIDDIISDISLLPAATLDLLALILWLIPLIGTVFVLGSMWMREEIQISQALSIAAMLFLVVFILPLDQAITANFIRAQEYLSPGTVTRAFHTGIMNTLRVVIASLVATTILGVLVGIGLLSNNWMVRNISKVYVEIFRNTPLLIQLLFIYRTLTLVLPFPQESITSPLEVGPLSFENHLYYLNARGFYYPSVIGTDTANILWLGLIIGALAFYFIRSWRLNIQEETGEPARTWRYALPAFLGIVAVAWVIAGEPFTVNYPALPEDARNVEGGTRLSIGFVSLFLGLTLYTGAFVAEIVRAGIQAVPYGQIEAARAQGLRGGQVLSHVVLPQALRLIIPPLGNQYVNLGKNSSLGLAVTYVETFRIAQLANNEKGQAVAFFAGLMAIYLMLSLVLSFFTNLINRSTQIKTR